MSCRIKRIVSVYSMALGLLAAWPCELLAQTNIAKTASPSNRYLLIVETSRSMQRRADGAFQVLDDLLGSGMRGQLRRGDTLGLWTFNADLYAGRFPLQQWTPETKGKVTENVLGFLQAQKYEKSARIKKVLPTMQQIIRSSEFITVVLVTEGGEDIQGTPFDQRINEAYKQWREQQAKVQMPLVTVLRAERGQIVDCSVSPAPFGVELPPLPPALIAAQTVETNPAPASRTVSPPMAPPLIIRGKKPEPAGVEATAPAAGTSKTNAVPDASASPATKPVMTPVTQPEVAPSASSNSPAALTAASDAAMTSPATNQLASQPTGTNAAVPAPSVEAAVAIPPAPPASRNNVWLAGFILAGAVAGATVLLLRLRRTRSGRGASFITRSLDRENK